MGALGREQEKLVSKEASHVGLRTADRTARLLRTALMLTALVDLLVLVGTVALAWNLRDVFGALMVTKGLAGHVPLVSCALVVASWLFVLAAQGGYNVRNFGSGPDEFRRVALASAVTVGGVGLTCYLLQLPLSRSFAVLTFVIGTPLLLLSRYALRQCAHRLRERGHLLHRVVAIGGPSGINEVVDALKRNRYVGYEVVGVCVPDVRSFNEADFPVPVLGAPREVGALCEVVGADTVLVARGGFASSHELRRIAWDLEGTDIELIVVPSLTDIAGPRIAMRPVAGLPLLHVEQPQAGAAGGIAKRLFDVAAALFALTLLSPIFAVVAALVRLQDGGAVFFRQARVGRNGAHFSMFKFRSMVVDAEQLLGELDVDNDSDGVLFKMRADPRITRLGRFLRRYSIDELPQLLNVLRGEMSLVGPRPPLPKEVDQYATDVHRRLLVRPGLTGLWQVSGRSDLSWAESVRLDLYYVDNWSMTSDLVIIAKTVRAVLGRDGAY